jgi:hypothetical protein
MAAHSVAVILRSMPPASTRFISSMRWSKLIKRNEVHDRKPKSFTHNTISTSALRESLTPGESAAKHQKTLAISGCVLTLQCKLLDAEECKVLSEVVSLTDLGFNCGPFREVLTLSHIQCKTCVSHVTKDIELAIFA